MFQELSTYYRITLQLPAFEDLAGSEYIEKGMAPRWSEGILIHILIEWFVNGPMVNLNHGRTPNDGRVKEAFFCLQWLWPLHSITSKSMIARTLASWACLVFLLLGQHEAWKCSLVMFDSQDFTTLQFGFCILILIEVSIHLKTGNSSIFNESKVKTEFWRSVAQIDLLRARQLKMDFLELATSFYFPEITIQIKRSIAKLWSFFLILPQRIWMASLSACTGNTCTSGPYIWRGWGLKKATKTFRIIGKRISHGFTRNSNRMQSRACKVQGLAFQ